MRIYISGPITGTKDAQERFTEAEIEMRAAGHDVVNPEMLKWLMPIDATHEEYMKICYPLLGLCHAIYMMEGWEHSKGAVLEYTYATDHGITIVFQGGKRWERADSQKPENLIKRLEKRLNKEIGIASSAK